VVKPQAEAGKEHEPELGTELENYAYHKKVEKNSALETEFAEEQVQRPDSTEAPTKRAVAAALEPAEQPPFSSSSFDVEPQPQAAPDDAVAA
jgi:hypothetical protein